MGNLNDSNEDQKEWVINKVNYFKENIAALLKLAEEELNATRSKIYNEALYGDGSSLIRSGILELKENFGIKLPMHEPKVVVEIIRNLLLTHSIDPSDIENITGYFKKVLNKNDDESNKDFIKELSWRMDSLIDIFDYGVAVKDIHGNYISMNTVQKGIYEIDKYIKICGINDYELLAHIYEKKDIDLIMEEEAQLLQTGKGKIERELEGRDVEGNEIYLKITKIPIVRENEVMGLVIKIEDITSRKNEEIEEEKIFEDIVEGKDQFEKLSNDYLLQQEELREVITRLKKLTKAIKKILGIIGHDLRNKIGILPQVLDILAGDDLDDNERCEMRKVVKESVESAINILEECLAYGRSGDLEPHPEILDLKSVVDEIISYNNRNANKKKIDVVLKNCEGNINSDKYFLKTILRNLLSNAIKFTPENGSVIIEFEEKNDYYYFYVIDTGVGIEEENIKKIFDETEGYTTYGTNGEKGIGYGLSACRNDAIKCGGYINVESTVGKGSKFILKMPVDMENIIKKSSELIEID